MYRKCHHKDNVLEKEMLRNLQYIICSNGLPTWGNYLNEKFFCNIYLFLHGSEIWSLTLNENTD
jgi:hypothetical protein